MNGNTRIMMSGWTRRAKNAHSTAKSNVSETLKVSISNIKLTAWALVLALTLFGGTTASAMPSPSNWLLNLSTASNPEYDPNNPTAPYWVNTAPQVAVSGQYVHVVWYSYIYSWDIDAKRQLVYRRSTDGGVTFEPAVVLLDETIGTDETYSGIWNSTCPQLAVDGAHVHVIYRWKTKGSTTPVGLKYRRSTNNGATFEPVVALVSPAVGAAGVDTNVFIAAQNGKVAIAYSTNIRVDNYMDLQASCLHSHDNGATFANTKLINYHSETGWTYYYVQVVDLVMSGNYVYAMVTRVDSNSYITTGMDFIIGSSDGGVTFKTPAVVSAISEDGKYYPSVFRGGSAYSPNIAANGANAYVVWQNLYTDTASPTGRWRLMVRRTTDGFATIGDPALVKEYPDGSGLPYPGLETIALKDGNLCVAAYESNGWTYIWNSTASGASWGTGINITKQNYTGDTLICPDPATGSTVFNVIANWYFRSTDGGATFNGGVNEHLPPGVVGVWRTPAISVGADGVVHAIASYGDTSNLAIYYRRLATPPAPGATNKSLELVNNSDAGAPRYDNMQAAGSTSLAFTTALTAEFWVKCTSDDILLHFTPIVSKPLDYSNSFEIGIYPYTGQIYGQVMTESASSGPLLNSSGLVKDAWTHLAITYNAASTADNFKLYVNGVEANKATVVGNIKNITPDYPLVLGKTGWGGDFEKKNSSMRIDELRLWNKALTAAEILAGKDKTMTGSEPGLVARYGFDDTTIDSTPNANNGILMFKETYVADHAPTPTPTPVPVLFVAPSNQAVAKDAGTTAFSVSNTGTATMPWTAAVTTGDSWLTITSGASGTNSGTINCSFTANTSTSSRTATIRVTAAGATGSPQEVTVIQAWLNSLTIFGNVKTSSGAAISEVSITFNNGGGTATTDGGGNYSVTVPYSYSGAATPSKNGFTFIPTSRTYSNVTANKSDENYAATTLKNPIIGSNSIDGVDVVKITDMSGSLPAGGGAVTIKAWDKNGKELTTAGYASPLSVSNHGTTSILGQDIEDRFSDGTPAAYIFSVESPKMFISNVNNSIDGNVKVPIIYSNGLSNFVSNSIGSRNTLKVTDMSGAIASGGIAITVAAWDATGKAIPESTSAAPMKLNNHGTTTIAGSSITARFPSGTPMTYEFTIASPKLIVSNVKNSSDGTLNIPTVYTIGVSKFVSNSIGFRNTIYISDFSGTLDIGGAAIKVRAWDVSGAEIPESESVSSYKIAKYETVKINGAELANRFSSGSPMTYEFTVDSPNVVITNVKSSTDGSINIPTVYTSGITNYTTNYVSDLNTIQITDMSGGIPSGGASITIVARDVDGKLIPETGGATALKLNSHGTTTIEGNDLQNRFLGGVPVTFEFSIGSSSVLVTNLTKSTDGTINIPTVFTIGPYGGI